MFANYCRILFRNLGKTRLYAFINILSLGIGIATLIWGIQNYRFNTSYDKFHRNREQIYRVMITVAEGDGDQRPLSRPDKTAAVGIIP